LLYYTFYLLMESLLCFKKQSDFRAWLEKNHSQHESIWLVFLKNDKTAFKHSEALEEALCFGWIDSIIKRIDDKKYKMKFSQRRKNSNWSEINKKVVEALIKSGKMTIYGQAAINEAKQNGNWNKDIKPVFTPEMIETLRNILKSETKLLPVYDALSSSNQQFFAYYYFDAKKEETKKKRLEKIIEHIESGKRIL
jgi:uncharacterized protein YdeI (YjbR/CyaY-like superfamily)